MWNKEYYHSYEVHCPVCKAYLGVRDPQILFSGHCSECKAIYYWKPWETDPIASLDKDLERKRCGCVNCKGKGR